MRIKQNKEGSMTENSVAYLPDTKEIKQNENNFTYHAPKGNQTERYSVLRDKAKDLADLMLVLCPPSRERSLALTKLEECSMWGNAAIARNE
jgi:hypothetical protein